MRRFIFSGLVFFCKTQITANNLTIRDPFNKKIIQKSNEFEISGILCTGEDKIVSLIHKDQCFVAHINEIIDKEWKIIEITDNFILLQNIINNEQKKVNLN